MERKQCTLLSSTEELRTDKKTAPYSTFSTYKTSAQKNLPLLIPVSPTACTDYMLSDPTPRTTLQDDEKSGSSSFNLHHSKPTPYNSISTFLVNRLDSQMSDLYSANMSQDAAMTLSSLPSNFSGGDKHHKIQSDENNSQIENSKVAPYSLSYEAKVFLSQGKTTHRVIQLAVGAAGLQGMRSTMEDCHLVGLNGAQIKDIDGNVTQVSLFAIFDGHNGRRVAELGVEILPEYVFHHPALGENNALALVESIIQTDKKIFQIIDRERGGGSTLICALIYNRLMFIACLGDARAILVEVCKTAIAMSDDHKPNKKKEAERIVRCGGMVTLGRVCGCLAVSRALGDYEFKFSGDKFVSNKEFMVSNIADVKQINLTDQSRFLIMACDGLWDVVSNEEAAEFVSDWFKMRPANFSFVSKESGNGVEKNKNKKERDVAEILYEDAELDSPISPITPFVSQELLSPLQNEEMHFESAVEGPDSDSSISSKSSSKIAIEKILSSDLHFSHLLDDCALELAKYALDKSSMDNVSVLIVCFHASDSYLRSNQEASEQHQQLLYNGSMSVEKDKCGQQQYLGEGSEELSASYCNAGECSGGKLGGNEGIEFNSGASCTFSSGYASIKGKKHRRRRLYRFVSNDNDFKD